MIKVRLPLFLIMILFSCNSNYLSQSELSSFVADAKILEINTEYLEPFDTLNFDKVIAYDFDGNQESHSNIINYKNDKFVPVISNQKELTLKQVNSLIDFLTDYKTYGKETAACFIPHMGIIFYQGQKRKLVINICLDCNYLISTSEIPATQYTKFKFDDGTSYGLRGFSDEGKQKIIDLSKELNLNYGQVEDE